MLFQSICLQLILKVVNVVQVLIYVFNLSLMYNVLDDVCDCFVCLTAGYAQPYNKPSSGTSYCHANCPVFCERE